MGWFKPMYILIVKNYETKTTHVEKFSVSDYCFPTLNLAEERGKQLLSLKDAQDKPKYSAFNTMELNYFIESMVERWGIGV